MAESKIYPTRTSADPNSSADANATSVQALDKAGSEQLAQLTTESSPASTDLFLMERASDGALRAVESQNLPGSGGGGDPYQWQVNSWNTPTTNPAELERVIFTNGFEWVAWFDSTTVEYLTKNTKVPSDINTSGTVTFEIFVLNAVTTSSNVVQYSIEHSSRADGETMNAAFTAEDSGDKSVDDQTVVDADDYILNRITWTETVTNLGWTANDNLRLRLKRIAPSGSNVPGDSGVCFIRIDIPRSS